MQDLDNISAHANFPTDLEKLSKTILDVSELEGIMKTLPTAAQSSVRSPRSPVDRHLGEALAPQGDDRAGGRRRRARPNVYCSRSATD